MNDSFRQLRAAVMESRQSRDERENEYRAHRAERLAVEKQLEALRRSGRVPEQDDEGLALLARRERLLGEERRTESIWQDSVRDAGERFDRFTQAFERPESEIERLSARTPIVLLPVRIETRFMRPAGKPELWVRLFPDEIAVENHTPELTEREYDDGRRYWLNVWRAGGDRAAELGAWRVLVHQYGAPRAAWVARALTPANPADQPAAPVPAGNELDPPPDFPAPPLAPESWNRAPRVRSLPDRFVVMTYAGGARTHAVVGNPVPDPLFVGMDPSKEAPDIAREGKELVVDPSLAWLVDFEEAVRVGMGMKIGLTEAEVAAGFDRVMALGLRFSDDEVEAPARLAALLDSHHYTKGLALVPQGTPTNNTEEAPSGLVTREDAAEPSFATERGAPLFTRGDETPADGQRLANALAIPDSVLDHVASAGTRDHAEARWMNTALFPATLGYFLEEMLDLPLQTVRRVRRFMLDHVTGRGALPAIRVGRQPYGFLPATRWSRLTFAGRRDPFPQQLLTLLRRIEPAWENASRRVRHVGFSNDPEADLLDILGLHPASVEYHQRFAVGPEYRWNLMTFFLHDREARAQREALRTRALQLLRSLGLEAGSPPPKLFDLTFMTGQTALRGPLIDGNPLSESRAIAPIDAGLGNYLEWLLTSDIDTVRAENFGVAADGAPRPAPTALLYLLMRHALLLESWDTTMRLLTVHEMAPVTARRETELPNVRAGAAPTRWDYFEAVIPGVTGGKPLREFLFDPLIFDQSEAQELREYRDALSHLTTLPTARLERLMAEHIDLCNYRLDAWFWGLLESRRAELSGGDGERPGLFLGAVGWVENLRAAAPRQPVSPEEIPQGMDLPEDVPVTEAPENAGHMHAPSINHASAAAILRGAYLSHANAADPERMSVNLSSERVRRALGFFEGMRNGQSLGALLGYQFERGLHDSSPALALDQFLQPLRRRFPLAADPRRPVAPGVPAEAIAARNVVDGLALVRASRAGPYPYGATGLPAASSEAGQAIQRQVDRLQDSLDAVSDLALAEGIFQAAHGNVTRTSAALDAVSKGGTPPEPEVALTPRSGTPFTQRLFLTFDRDAPAANPLPATPLTPRAVMEPRLNRYVAGLLGDPATVRVRVDLLSGDTVTGNAEVTWADLGLQPLDMLYISMDDLTDDESELAKRVRFAVRRALALPHDQTLRLDWEARDAAWGLEIRSFSEWFALLTPLRMAVTGARALTAADFRSPAASLGTERHRYDTAELRARVVAARDALQAVSTALGAAANADAMRGALFAAAAFGVPDSVPAFATESDAGSLAELDAQRLRVGLIVTQRLAAASAALAAPFGAPDEEGALLLSASEAIFGSAFRTLPFVTPHEPAQWASAYAQRGSIGATAATVEGWAQGVSRVRPRVAQWETVRAVADGFDPDAALSAGYTVAQLPHLPGDRWLALPFEPGQPPPNADKVAIALISPPGYDAGRPQSGLLLEEWVEVIPNDMETTGLAFHFDQPNAEPPQAILYVLPAELKETWTWEDLEQSVIETLGWARKRAVEPDRLAETPFGHLLPAILAATSTEPVTIGLDLALNYVAVANP